MRLGNLDALLNEVAALAAASRNRALIIRFFIHTVCNADGVFRLIQSISRVIRHTAVNRNIVLEAGDLFLCADGVKRHACVRNNASARFHKNLRHINVLCGTFGLKDFRKTLDIGSIVNLRVTLNIADTHSAADVKRLSFITLLVFDLCDKVNHYLCGVAERLVLKNLRTDMAMIASQLNIFERKCKLNKLVRLTRFNRRTELGIDLAR